MLDIIHSTAQQSRVSSIVGSRPARTAILIALMSGRGVAAGHCFYFCLCLLYLIDCQDVYN